MDRARLLGLLAVLAAALVAAGSASGEPEATSRLGPLQLRLDVAARRPSPPGDERPLRAIGAGALPSLREEASLDARYELDLGKRTHVGLHYRGVLAREGALTPTDRQRHAPELRVRQRLAEGLTARLGWQTTAEWREEMERELLLGGRGFAELDLELGEGWGHTRIRYEHERPDLLGAEAAPAPRHRASAQHALPRIELPEGLALELRPGVALDAAGEDEASAPEVFDAHLTALLESRLGPQLRTRLGYARRLWEGTGSAAERHAASLRAATRLELPVREGLRIGLELGWEGTRESARVERRDVLRARAGLDLHF